MVRFGKPDDSIIYTDIQRNMMVLNNQDFIIENLTVRFTIYVFSVIFKNSAAVTNTHSGNLLLSYAFVQELGTLVCNIDRYHKWIHYSI